MPSVIVLAENLTKVFGTTIALDCINLKLNRGFHLLLGPNGSGKSTFIKLCLGLLKPSKGKLHVLGLKPWVNRHLLSSMVSYVIEGFNLPWWLNGREYAYMFSRLKGIDWSHIRDIAEYLSVTSYWDRYIRVYSSGMKKKLMLALGLVDGYELYLLDEPFTLIDEGTRRKVYRLIEKLRKNATVIIATHVITEQLTKITSTISLLVNGKLKLHAKTSRLTEGNIPLKVVVNSSDLENILEITKELGISRIEVNTLDRTISFTISSNMLKYLRERLRNTDYHVYLDANTLYSKMFSLTGNGEP